MNGPFACIRLVIFLMCAGVAYHRYLEYDVVSSFLYIEKGWLDEPAANLVSLIGAIAYAVAGCLVLTAWVRPAAIWVGIWTLLLLTLHMLKGTAWVETMPGSWAVRWMTPFALFVWASRRSRGEDVGIGVELTLRVAAAATFAFHGMKAAGFSPFDGQLVMPYAEYLDFLATVESWTLGEAFDQDTNEWIARAIGIADCLVAVAILSVRWRAIAAWMAFWGLITAAVRILAYEETGVAKFLMRAGNAGVPLTVLLLWLNRTPQEATSKEDET